MATVEEPSGARSSGVTRTRCDKCKRFARLLPGDRECAACAGVLALAFGTITRLSDTTVRGGW
ncbi:hypothetical protein DFQ13_102210 [Actinokineospora spheciospongiae]|nr:hypothetical protein DFQ13_102210 [Actinokineospora spheciospongiae]